MASDDVVRLLTERGVPFTVHEHAPMRTVSEHQALLPFDTARYLKTLVFRVNDSAWVLTALKGLDRIDYRRLADALGVSRAAIRAATPEEVASAIGCEVGGVCPIPLRDGVALLIDRDATSMDVVYCGSGRSDRTLELRMTDLLQLVNPRVVPLRREESAERSNTW